VICGEEGLRISLHPKVAFVIATLDRESLPVFAEARKKPPAHSKTRRPVARPLFDPRQSEKESSDGSEFYWLPVRHWTPILHSRGEGDMKTLNLIGPDLRLRTLWFSRGA
jgi:hypothetical protein